MDVVAIVAIMGIVVQEVIIHGDGALGVCLDFQSFMAVQHPQYDVVCIRTQEVAQ